ncbi:MAG: hypothetical protein P8130_10100 [Deltaproteobacteria bacterium]
MQDKLLFAAGLVALLIGLFVGVRSDNVRKTAEENLANVSRRVESVEQQLKTEEDRNKVIADKLSGMENKVNVAQDKLTVANNWYASLQKTNATLANDIYSIRLDMVDVLANLKAEPSVEGQASISQKIEKLVAMLDEHNAAANTAQPMSKEESAAPEQKQVSKAVINGGKGKPESEAKAAEKAPAAAPAKEKESSAEPGPKEKAVPAENMEKSDAGTPQAAAPAGKQHEAAPPSNSDEKQEGAVRL